MGRSIDVDAFIREIRKTYCEDCARRKGIKNGKMRFCYEIGGVPCRACDIEDVLDALDDFAPTITPERKKGKWIKEYWNGEHTRKCSACNITQTVTTYRGKVSFNYCPYCGADMRGEQDE